MTVPPRPDEPDPSQSPLPLRPLTRKRTNGEPYTRRPEVEEQIHVALALDPDELLQRARISDYRHPDHLKEECLVYLFDEYRCRDDQKMVREIHAIILTRCSRTMWRRLRKLGEHFHQKAAREAVGRLQYEMMDAMGRGAILQIAFGRRLKCLLDDVYDKYDRQRKHARLCVSPDDIAGEAPAGTEQEAQHRPDEAAVDAPGSPERLFQDGEKKHLLAQALDALPDPRWREAVVLHIIEGYPIRDQVPVVL